MSVISGLSTTLPELFYQRLLTEQGQPNTNLPFAQVDRTRGQIFSRGDVQTGAADALRQIDAPEAQLDELGELDLLIDDDLAALTPESEAGAVNQAVEESNLANGTLELGTPGDLPNFPGLQFFTGTQLDVLI